MKGKLPKHKLQQPRPLLFSTDNKKEDKGGQFFKKWQQIRLGLKKYSGFFLEQYRQNSQDVIRSRHDNFHFDKIIQSRNSLYPLMEFESFMPLRGAKPAKVALKKIKPKLGFFEKTFLTESREAIVEENIPDKSEAKLTPSAQQLDKLPQLADPTQTGETAAETKHILSPPLSYRHDLKSSRRQATSPRRQKANTTNTSSFFPRKDDKLNISLPSPFARNALQAGPFSPTSTVTHQSQIRKSSHDERGGKSFITDRKTPEVRATALPRSKRVSTIADSLERQNTSITTSRPPAQIPSKHIIYVIPQNFNPNDGKNTQFAKMNLAQIVSSLFPPPPKSVLEKEPPESILSYGRQVMLHEPTKQLQQQAFQYLIESMAEGLKDQFWEEPQKSSKSLAKLLKGRKPKAPDFNYRYLFTIDGEPIERFAELTHECKVIIISPHSRFSLIQGIQGFLDREKVLKDREETIRTMFINQGDSWFFQNMEKAKEKLDEDRKRYHEPKTPKARRSVPQGKMTPRMVALERQKKLVDLATNDLRHRIGITPKKKSRKKENVKVLNSESSEDEKEEQESEQNLFNLEDSLSAYLEKVHYERKLKKAEMHKEEEEEEILELKEEQREEVGLIPDVFSPTSLQRVISPRQTVRSTSQPRKGLMYRSPTPGAAGSPTSGRRKTGERRTTTASTAVRAAQFGDEKIKKNYTPLRKVGFEVQKMKRTSVHMSIDFGGPTVKVQKEPEPIVPTPLFREAPLLQVNRPQTGWNCTSQRYKKIKMTKRDVNALEGLIKASRAIPMDHRRAVKIVRETQSRHSLSPPMPQTIQLNEDKIEKRGLRFKEIEEFREQYSLTRKEIYAIKSRFMSLDRMAQAACAVASKVGAPLQGISGSTQRRDGITLGQFLQTSPLVKDLDPNVARRLIQALGIDPGNQGQKVDWKHYVELYCILTQNDTNIEILSKFWIKYIDPQSLGVISVDRLIELLQDLLRGKSEGANAWIIHHFSGNFIKRLVIESVIDPDKRTVDLFKLQSKFTDPNSVATPKMLSKATGQQEFEDVFQELHLSHSQERLFNHLIAPPVQKEAPVQKKTTGSPSFPAPRTSYQGSMQEEGQQLQPEKSYAEDGLESEDESPTSS